MSQAEPDNDNEPAWNLSQPGSDQTGDDWNPYQASWTQSGSVIVQSQAVSTLSILSLISGVLSVLPCICLCSLSIPFSLFAIVSGHISRGICRRSQGRVAGDSMAVAGLALGYFSLLVTIGIWGTWFAAFSSAPTVAPVPPRPPVMLPPEMTQSNATQQLDEAIEMVSQRLSAGNSDDATALALHLEASLHDISQQLQADSVPVSDGSSEPDSTAESPTIVAELPATTGSIETQQALAEASVYCALQDDSCAFLVEISNWVDLKDAESRTLSQMIWLAAGRSVNGHLKVGEDFAVALVSNGLLVEISLGQHERSDHFDAGVQHRGPADDQMRLELEEFFEPVPTAAMPTEAETTECE